MLKKYEHEILSYIENYIEEYKSDGSGSWEYQHFPHLKKILAKLSKEESYEFCKVIWSWSEFHLFNLADPILFCGYNGYIDENFLYSKLFGEISDLESLEYLCENLSLSKDDIKTWDNKVLQKIENNLKKVMEIEDLNSSYISSHIRNLRLLKDELQQRANT